MSSTPDVVFGARSPEDGRHLGRRRRRNAVFTGLVGAAVAVALVPLVAIVSYVLRKGSGVIGWDFLTKPIPILSRSIGPGMGPAILGTLVITGTATVMAVPLGILAAVVANQFGEASGTHRAALIGLGVVLFVMTVLVNLLARRVTSRADRRLAGGQR